MAYYNDYRTFGNRVIATEAVSYTHLDVYKRQEVSLSFTRMFCGQISCWHEDLDTGIYVGGAL